MKVVGSAILMCSILRYGSTPPVSHNALIPKWQKRKKKKKKNEDVCHRDQHYISQAYTHTNTNLCRNGITRSMGGA